MGIGLVIGLVAGLAWWVLSFQPSQRAPLDIPASREASTETAAADPMTSADRPKSSAVAQPAQHAQPALAFEPPPIMRDAAAACARAGTQTHLSIHTSPDVPGIEGEHPAQIWCTEGRLQLVQFSHGEDAWITWEHTERGIVLTVVDYNDVAVRTGYRQWVNGRLAEHGTVENLENGIRRMTTFKDDQKAKVMAVREGQISDSTLAALDRHLDTLDLTAEQRASNRESRMMFDAYQLEETYRPDGELKFRSETLNADEGEGWLVDQIRVDANGDGQIDGWILGRRHVDGRSRSVIVLDADRDGRFDRKTLTVDFDRQPSVPIDWPVEAVTAERLKDLLGP